MCITPVNAVFLVLEDQFLRTKAIRGQQDKTSSMWVQGTKACLGWDREPQGGSHACTAVVDLWLQLLQLCLHLSHKLPRGPADSLARQGSMDHALDPALDIRSQVAVLVKSYQASLQELMTQLLVHWKVYCHCCILNHSLFVLSSMHQSWFFELSRQLVTGHMPVFVLLIPLLMQLLHHAKFTCTKHRQPVISASLGAVA